MLYLLRCPCRRRLTAAQRIAGWHRFVVLALARAKRLSKASKDSVLAGQVCKLQKARRLGQWPCRPAWLGKVHRVMRQRELKGEEMEMVNWTERWVKMTIYQKSRMQLIHWCVFFHNLILTIPFSVHKYYVNPVKPPTDSVIANLTDPFMHFHSPF